MSELVLTDPLATEVRRMATAEGQTAEEVLRAAMNHYRAVSRQRKIKAEADWWVNAAGALRSQYAGEYVAVHLRKVVDHDPDENALFERVQKGLPDVAVLITPAGGRPEIRFRHPKLERQ